MEEVQLAPVSLPGPDGQAQVAGSADVVTEVARESFVQN